MNDEQINLRPCPFCGADPESGAWDEHGFAIQCSSNLSKCPINPAYSGYDHQATIDRWNTRAALTPPEGYVLVPMEPTREMIDAYVAVDARFNSARHDWAVMLAARPEVTP